MGQFSLIAAASVMALVIQSSHSQPCITTTTSLTTNQFNTIVNDLRNRITIGNGLTAGDTVGAIVRLAFHDAAGFNRNANGGAGDSLGVDGCVDLTQPGNNGLQTIIGQLDTWWQPHCSVISKADFWVLAAKVAVEMSSNVPGYTVPFRYGRTSASTCAVPPGESRLPGAEDSMAGEMDRIMINNMGLTEAESIALIGAHTLGRTQTANSGYNGPWVPATGVFDNRFFDDLANRPWTRTVNDQNPNDIKTTWVIGAQTRRQMGMNGPGPTIMLNTDMSLVFDGFLGTTGPLVCFPVNQNGGPNCGVRHGGRFDTVQQFLGPNGNNNFHTAFASAFQSMTEVGQTSLSDVADPVGQPTASPVTSSPTTSTPTASPATSSPTPSPTTQSPTTSSPPPPPPPPGGMGPGGMGPGGMGPGGMGPGGGMGGMGRHRR